MKKSALAVIALFALLFGCARDRMEEYSMITFMIGEVTKNGAPVQIGDIIKEKDVITTAADSFCDIKIGNSLIRIKQKSKIVMSGLLKKNGIENTSIDLDSGKLLCKPRKLFKSETFMVKTATAVAAVRGTQFTVETDAKGTSRIKVYEGQVKVAKRIKELDNNIYQILDLASEVAKDEKVVITKADVEKVEKVVASIMKEESAKGGDAAIAAVIKKAGSDVAVSKRNIEKFAVKDFEKDNKEIIAIKEKPAEVIKEINKVIEEEKTEPKPNGRILVTRFEVYFIKDGKVEWEGKVIEEPVKQNDRLYVASGEYVFCASLEGPVIWRKQVPNEGKLLIKENALVVSAQGQETRLDLKTGENL